MSITTKIKSLHPGLLLILFILLLSSCREESFSPSQADSFIKFFGLNHRDKGFDVKVMNDGGYILAGTTTTEDSGTDIVLIRTDRFGNEQWGPKQFGGTYDYHAYNLIKLSGGGFALAGSTIVETEDQSLTSNMLLVRTNEQGDTLWTKNYGSNSNETAYNLAETSDGGFILIGSTENIQTGQSDVLLVKTDSEGSVEWTRTHLGGGVGTYIAETEDGFIYTGYTRIYAQAGQSNNNIFVVKTNSLGRVTFPYTYGGNGDDSGKSIFPLPEGGFILLGTITNSFTGIKSIFLAKLGEDISSPEWIKTYGGQISHVAGSVKRSSEGNFIISGTQEISENNHVIFLLKTDAVGNELFLKTYGGSGSQSAESLDLTSDGGYVIAGSNESGENSMITLIKTKADGDL